jgi:MFS transporter, DHA1 family, solute carrier family 18 (vesicular amine transporter), member 1/2
MPRRLPILVIAVGAITIDSALLGLIAPLLPDIEQRTGASDSALGIALAVYAVPIALLSLPLGRAADVVGRRILLIEGMALVTAGSVLIAFSDSLALVMAGRAVQGIGSASTWIAALALVSDLAPPGKRGESLGAALAATSLGAIAGPALGGVTAELISFAAPFLIVAAASVALLVAGIFVLPHGAPQEPPETGALATIARSTRSGLGAYASAIIFAAAGLLGLIEVVTPLDLDERLGLSSGAIGLLFGASIIVDAISAPIGGRWGDRSGRRGPAVWGLIALAASTVLLSALPGIAGAGVGLGVMGIGFSFSFAAAIPWLDEAFEESERGLAYGVLNLLYAAGYAIGPVIGGALLEVSGADLPYLLSAALLVAGAAALWLATRSVRSAA